MEGRPTYQGPREVQVGAACARIHGDDSLAAVEGGGSESFGDGGGAAQEQKVPTGLPRGGLLTQASILKVTANGTATSPVLRGVWVMERLLGVPRLPPPPNIPAIEPDATGATTIRQMVEMHRADRACAVCHDKMDPYGLAMESFDPIGGQRDRYRLDGAPKKIRRGKEEAEEPSIEVVSMPHHDWGDGPAL